MGKPNEAQVGLLITSWAIFCHLHPREKSGISLKLGELHCFSPEMGSFFPSSTKHSQYMETRNFKSVHRDLRL